VSEHVFWNPDKFEQRPERDFIRKHCPNGSDGLVVEDLDLLLRCYGPNYGTDAAGKFRLVELKHANAPLGTSKLKTFRLIDSLLAPSPRYDGFYVVRTDSPEWETVPMFTVNQIDLEFEEFVDWLNFRLAVPPMWREKAA
jgi:hypothetical protein